jgi:hypothetical protein
MIVDKGFFFLLSRCKFNIDIEPLNGRNAISSSFNLLNVDE